MSELIQKRYRCPKCQRITLAHINARWCEHCYEETEKLEGYNGTMQLIGLEMDGEAKCSICHEILSYRECYVHLAAHPQGFALIPLVAQTKPE